MWLLRCFQVFLWSLLLLWLSFALDMKDIKEDDDYTYLNKFQSSIVDAKTFDYDVSIKYLEMIDEKSLLTIPLMMSHGNIPLLHQLLNLFFQSAHSVVKRKQLVDLINKCLDYNVIDVDEKFNNDPSVIVKSVILREIGLSIRLASQSSVIHEIIDHSLSSDDIVVSKQDFSDLQKTFYQLYSIPCEPVPLVKLLLHADTLMRSKSSISSNTSLESSSRDDSEVRRLDEVKSLLLSANNPSGSKSNVKIYDLIEYSDIFMDILHHLGTSTVPGLTLDEVIHSLDELASSAQQLILSSFTTYLTQFSSNHSKINANKLNKSLLLLGKLLSSSTDSSKRNVFHYLSFSGSYFMLSNLTSVLEQIVAEKSPDIDVEGFRGLVSQALLVVDVREYLPYHYAALRYGVHSTVFKSIERLYDLLGIALSSRQITQLESQFKREITAKSSRESSSVDEVCELASSDCATDSSIDEGIEDDGGWDDQRIKNEFLESNIERCDIQEIWITSPTDLPSVHDFYYSYIRTGTPVIFRDAIPIDSKYRQAFTKTSFVNKYGKDIVPLGSIPYAGSFGVKASTTTLGYVANITSVSDASSSSKSEDSNKYSYAFTTAHTSWKHKLQIDTQIPTCIEYNPLTNKYLSEEAGNVECQFYLGPAGSGAPVHYHGHAINSLAWGEKKWFIYPPNQAFYSTMMAYEWISQDSRVNQSLQCTQRAGDMMFVPTLWGHATLNTKQSIGVAHEFSIESFCME